MALKSDRWIRKMSLEHEILSAPDCVYLAALRNPEIHILGHPRGRVYNYRVGLRADWEKVFGTAAELDKAVEIDGYPDRQDLNIDLLKLANKAGCRISFGTDSHGAAQLRFMEYSAASALIAGVPRDRILNFMSLNELIQWAETLRESPPSAAQGCSPKRRLR